MYSLPRDLQILAEKMAKIIVFGNEKGGSGKSTTAIHVAIALCYQNKNVGIIDLDIRQKSMFRFLENRSDFCRKQKSDLPRPTFYKIDQSNNCLLYTSPSPRDAS